MRVWRQPLRVWMLGAAISASAAVAEAQQNENGRAEAEPAGTPTPNVGTIRNIDVDRPTGDIAPARELRQPERDAVHVQAGQPEAPAVQAPPDAFAEKMENLWRCRFEVAMEQRKAPAQVQAGKVLVRAEVDGDGNILAPTVVALEPATPEVLTCVTREVQGWQMDPAPGQRMRIETEVDIGGPPSNE